MDHRTNVKHKSVKSLENSIGKNPLGLMMTFIYNTKGKIHERKAR